MCTSLLIRGWAVRQEKHRLSQCGSSVFQPEKTQSVCGVHSSSSSVWVALPVPSVHSPPLAVTLNALACSAFEWLSSPFPSQWSTSHQYPVLYSAHQALAVSRTGRTAVAYSHPLAKQCLLLFLLLSICKLEEPPASCLSVKCCGPWGCMTLQSSRHTALYLHWLPWKWVDSSRTLKKVDN